MKEKVYKNNDDLSVLARLTKISKKTLKNCMEYIINKYQCNKDTWYEELKKDPYRLSVLKNMGFKRCDVIAEKIGFDMSSDIRLKYAVEYMVETSTEGDTIIEIKKVLEGLIKLLKRRDTGAMLKIIKENEEFMEYCLLDANLSLKSDKECKFITLKKWMNLERKIWGMCVNANKVEKKERDVVDKAIVQAEKKLPFKLNEKQNIALHSIPHENLVVLTGGGGTGKTAITRCVLDILDELGETYTIMCPTGTASKVMSNSTGREAMTIHRRYYTDPSIYTDWMILDESSMLSLDHFDFIFEMLCGRNIKVMMIGDINQLVSIGAGSPFRDIISLIECGKIKGHVSSLTKVERAKDDSAIPHICQMFSGLGEYKSSEIYKEHRGVDFIPLAEDVKTQISIVINQRGYNLKDTYILSPLNIRELGANAINDYMQYKFNKEEFIYEDKFKKYKKGDMLMHIKNNASLGIFNGERIILSECIGDEQYICHKVDDGVRVVYEKDVFQKETQLSYATTIHKSQGQSIKNVIVIMSEQHSFFNNRNMTYTALSRASENLIVLYDEKALIMASKRNETIKRKTFLRTIAERQK